MSARAPVLALAPGLVPVLASAMPLAPVRDPATTARSFHGTAEVSPATAKMRLVELAEEVIRLLCADPNASVKVTVEINAEFPAEVSDQIKRAVTENATSLGFKSTAWE